jgi:hypothetical protein
MLQQHQASTASFFKPMVVTRQLPAVVAQKDMTLGIGFLARLYPGEAPHTIIRGPRPGEPSIRANNCKIQCRPKAFPFRPAPVRAAVIAAETPGAEESK